MLGLKNLSIQKGYILYIKDTELAGPDTAFMIGELELSPWRWYKKIIVVAAQTPWFYFCTGIPLLFNWLLDKTRDLTYISMSATEFLFNVIFIH